MQGEFIDKFEVKGTFVEKRAENINKYVHRGSKFVLTREPDNQYDPNAIMVQLPVRGGQHRLDIGYVPKELAAAIAPVMDSGEREFKATFRVKITSEKTGKFIKLFLNLLRVTS